MQSEHGARMSIPTVCIVGRRPEHFAHFRRLPQKTAPGFPAAMLIVEHCPIDHRRLFPSIVGLKCALPVSHANDEATVAAGHVYIRRKPHVVVGSGLSGVTCALRLTIGTPHGFAEPVEELM